MFGIDPEMLKGLAVSYGLKIGAAFLILIIGNWLSKWICSIFAKVMGRYEVDITLTKFLRNILYYSLMAAVFVAAAGQLGINTASFLTIIGAAGLAVGLALKDSLSNFSAGVMLILFRPFRVNDWVTVAGETGKVEEITIFNTVISTGDNQRKIIPNGKVCNDTITNININPTRRIDMVIGVSYEDDLKQAETILKDIVAAEPRILADPPTTIAVAELADSSVNFVVRPWVNSGDYWDVKFKLTQQIKMTFDDAGITIPYPQRTIHVQRDAEAAT